MVGDAVEELRALLGDSAHDPALWAAIKGVYARRIESLADPEFLKTFFSSITRRLFDTVGVNPGVEFFALELDPLRGSDAARVTKRYVNRGSLDLLFEELLSDHRFRTPWRDFEGSVGHVTTDVELKLKSLGEQRPLREIEVDPARLPPDEPRLRGRLPARRRLDAAARDRLPQLAARRAGGRRDAVGRGRLGSVQLHALVLPRRSRARERRRAVPARHHAPEARLRALHRARPRQAGQDRALPRDLPPPRAHAKTASCARLASAGSSWPASRSRTPTSSSR